MNDTQSMIEAASEPAVRPPPAAPQGETAAPHVELKNVSLVYGEGDAQTLALDRLNMTVAKGEFVAVVGPSGCGKSTLMKLVTGLLPADGGAVLVKGEKLSGPIRHVGMAFQNSNLMHWRSTLRNVMLPFEIVAPHKHELSRHMKAYEDRALALLERVGLLPFAHKLPRELSGGMKQRANVCRALVHEPELLMLDEPFGALDAFTREELWQMTQSMWLERGFSAVLVTHDLREAVFLADRVVVMSARPGRAIFDRRIDLPRPRPLSCVYDARFGDIVKEIRAKVVEARDQ